MSRLSLIEKEKKRFFLFNKYFKKYKSLKLDLKNNRILENFRNKYHIFPSFIKLQNLPKNSNPTRLRNRCYLTGRPRGVFRRFGLSRCLIKDISFKGYAPGLLKSCW